jgi:hypothetical protein
MWQQTCALDRMATGIGLMIKLNIDNWGFASTLETLETYSNDDYDDDDDDDKVKGKLHPRTAHEVPERE